MLSLVGHLIGTATDKNNQNLWQENQNEIWNLILHSYESIKFLV